MNKKFILLSVFALIAVLPVSYIGYKKLCAGDNSSTCILSGSCSDKSKTKTEIKAGGEWNSYEFKSDRACCSEMKSSLKADLMSIGGVKDVQFKPIDDVSKTANVTVMFSNETTPDAIASFLKDKMYDCSGKECVGKGCENENKSGCDSKGKTGNCPHKNKEKKDI